jgi:RND family efflux transporter MFP subunit
LGVVLLAVAWLARGGDEARPSYPVERGDLVVTVPVSGTLEATRSLQLGPPAIPRLWNFKIAYLAPEGERVRAGTPVLRFDTSELGRELLRAVAERDSAHQELERRRTELAREQRNVELQWAEAVAELSRARLKVDVPAELLGAKELAYAKIDLELAERQAAHREGQLRFLEERSRAELQALAERWNRARRRVDEIQHQVDSLTVTAPLDGTVIYVSNWRDEKKKVGDPVWIQERVLEIPDLSEMEARGQVEEADAGRVAVGQPVVLRLDAHPDREYRGTVAALDLTVERASARQPGKVVQLTIALGATDSQRMRPGMRFRGRIEVGREAGVLLVPQEAIRWTPEGPVVLRRTLWGTEEVRPRLGGRDADRVAVTAGLAEGDVLLGGAGREEPRRGDPR